VPAHSGFSQPLLAFRDIDGQLEINQPRLHKKPGVHTKLLRCDLNRPALEVDKTNDTWKLRAAR